MITWEQAQQKVKKWQEFPIDDPEYDSPSETALQSAEELIRAFRALGAPQPIRVVPDGEGGVSIEFRLDGLFLMVNIEHGSNIHTHVFSQEGEKV